MIRLRWLLVGGAVVIAVVVLLIVKLTDSGVQPTTRRTDPMATADATTTDKPRRRPRPQGEEPPPPRENVRETVVDGVRIRDHRKGDHPLPELPANLHPPDRRRIAPQLVQDISGKLQLVMKECTSGIPADARGAKPKLEGVVFVEIRAGELKVTEATLQLRDVSGDAVETAKACIEQKAVGQSISAKDAEDTTRYSISVAFAIPAT